MKTLNKYISEHMFSGKKVTVNSQIGKYDYVDLDLPSGTLWGTCNIGADKPEEEGLLFQWGRTKGYKPKDNNHKFLNQDDYLTMSGSFYTLNEQVIKDDDAAYKATNGKFRMPTTDELDELFYNTEHIWINDSNNQLLQLTSKTNNNTIIIPVGCSYNSVTNGFCKNEKRIWLWSANAHPGKKGIGLYYDETKFSFKPYNGAHGFQIRAVVNKK